MSEILDIESQFEALDTRFGKIQTAARRELEVKHNAIELVEDELDSLPCKILKENHKYVTMLASRTKPFTNLKVFFHHLRLHCWNFFEYKVLEVLIKNNCSEDLKERMRNYASDVQSFMSRTKVSEFIKCGIAFRLVEKIPDVLETFKKLSYEHDIDPDTLTLSELDEFRTQTKSAVCKRYRLLECAIHVYRVKHKCIIVEWMVPEELINTLIDFYYDQDGRELQQIYRVQKLMIDGKSVPTVR